MSTIDRRSAGAGDPYYAESAAEAAYEQSGWLVFAATIIVFTGLWNAFEGIIASYRAAFFTGPPVFGALGGWGLVFIGLGVLQVAAGYGILAGRGWARWYGIVIVSISALAHMFAIATYPLWSLFILAIDIVILYALAVHWPRKIPATRVS
jgi:hypothetical protein